MFWREFLEVGSFFLLYMEERLCSLWSYWQSQGKPLLRENNPTEVRVKSGVKWVLEGTWVAQSVKQLPLAQVTILEPWD